MLTRLDHVLIGVHDLEAAEASFRRLGLPVRRAGSHPHLGTHNSIVPFGLQFLELIAIEEPRVATDNPLGRALQGFLDGGEGLFGFALAAEGLEEDVAELRRLGSPLPDPVPGEGRRVDGVVHHWLMSRYAGRGWRLLPFVIEFLEPDQERAGWLDPGLEKEPAWEGTRLGEVEVAARDPQEAALLYGRVFGSEVRQGRLRLGPASIRIVEAPRREGLHALTLELPALSRLSQVLQARGVTLYREGDRPLVDPAAVHGARLRLSSAGCREPRGIR